MISSLRTPEETPWESLQRTACHLVVLTPHATNSARMEETVAFACTLCRLTNQPITLLASSFHIWTEVVAGEWGEGEGECTEK